MPEREDVIGNDQRAATQAVIAALRERRSVKAMRPAPVPPSFIVCGVEHDFWFGVAASSSDT